MKKNKFLQNSIILFLLITVLSCSKDDEDNTPSGTYLTINGDTRKIIKNKDPDLRIYKGFKLYENNGNYTSSMLDLNVYDSNLSLIANFGEFNTSMIKLSFFILDTSPAVEGSYTINSTITWDDTSSKLDLGGGGEFTARVGQTFQVKEKGNQWVLEFKNLIYDSIYVVGKTANVSGRIIMNK